MPDESEVFVTSARKVLVKDLKDYITRMSEQVSAGTMYGELLRDHMGIDAEGIATYLSNRTEAETDRDNLLCENMMLRQRLDEIQHEGEALLKRVETLFQS